MSRWSSQTHEEAELDFDAVLNSAHNAVELLTVSNFIEEAKSRSSKFTQRIIQDKYRSLLFELIDIALVPKLYMQGKQLMLDKAATHGAIEILSNLSEEFIEEIFDKQPEQEDSVIQTEREFPILNHLFRVLTIEGAEETALAYLNKLITPFIYQRSEEMIEIVGAQLPQLINYFWNQSVAEIVTKVLQAENEKEFFEKEKIELVRSVCRSLAAEKEENKVERNIESFGGFMESLVEKHEDKYDKAKYAKLIRLILEDGQIFLFLFDQFESFPNNPCVRVEILHCIQAYLRIHLPPKPASKISDQNEKPQGIPLNEAFSLKVKELLSLHKVQEFVTDSRIQLLNYYKLVKNALLVEPGLVQQVLTKDFLTQTLETMQKDANNNILHNFQREVIVQGLRESQAVCRLLQGEVGVSSRFPSELSNKNSSSCFQNQLFLISEAVKERSQKSQLLTESWSKLSEIIETKRQFYSALIGGNPRGNDSDKWDSIENQGEMVLRSLNQRDTQEKQTIEERLEIDQPQKKIMMIQIATGLHDLGGTEVLSQEEDDPFTSPHTSQIDDPKNKHFFDFELPLDSDKQEDLQNNSNSLEDVPMVIKIDSMQDNTLRVSANIIASTEAAKSQENEKEEKSQTLPVVIEDPVEQTTHIIIDQSFKEEPNLPHIHCPSRQQIQTQLMSRYNLHLHVSTPYRDELSSLVLSKYNLHL